MSPNTYHTPITLRRRNNYDMITKTKGVGTMAQTKLSKDIKKLNERLAEFERHGLQESSQYKTLIGQLQSLSKQGLKIKTSKRGYTAIVNSSKYNEKITERLGHISENKNTYGKAKKQALELLGQSGQEKHEIVRTPKGEIIGTNMYGMQGIDDWDYVSKFLTNDEIIEELQQLGYSESDIKYYIESDEHYLPTVSTEGYTDEEIAEVLRISAHVHDIIVNYSNEVYSLEDNGEIALHSEKGGHGRLSYEEMLKISAVEQATELKRKEMVQKHKEYVKEKKTKKTKESVTKQSKEEANLYGVSPQTIKKADAIMVENDIFGTAQLDYYELIEAIENGNLEEYKRKNGI